MPETKKAHLSVSLLSTAYGAGTRSRTRDLLITSQLLYQLSYTGLGAHYSDRFAGVNHFRAFNRAIAKSPPTNGIFLPASACRGRVEEQLVVVAFALAATVGTGLQGQAAVAAELHGRHVPIGGGMGVGRAGTGGEQGEGGEGKERFQLSHGLSFWDQGVWRAAMILPSATKLNAPNV